MKKVLFGLLAVCFAIGTANAANNCTGATYYDADSDTCIACPTGYDANTDAGKTSATECQIHCNAGTYASGYTQLEYLESTGTQYIDTGVYPTNNTGISMDFQYTTEATRGQYLFGNIGPNFLFGRSNNTFVYGYTQGREATGSIPLSSGDNIARHTVELNWNNNGLFRLDDTIQQLPSVTFLNNWTMFLYASNDYGSVFLKTSGRVYSAKISNGTNLVHDMVPARRNNDGVLGMYDKVTNTFFTNAGTGTFVAGNDVAGLQCTDVGAGYYAAASTVNYGSTGTRNACPAGTYSSITNASSCTSCAGATYNDTTASTSCKSCPNGYDYDTTSGKTSVSQCQIHCDGGTWNSEYTQLTYLESTGTQYIDTGIIPTLNSGVYMRTALTAKKSSDNAIFGATEAVGFANGNPMAIDIYGDSVVYLPFGNASPANTISTNVALNQIYEYKINYLNSGKASVDNIEVNLGHSIAITTRSLHLFNMNSSTGGLARSATSGARIYEVILTESTRTSHHYVPARRNSDGVLGMYDKVSGQFFTNAGTGTFVAGNDVGALGGQCIDVGAGYYAAASTVNFGSIGTRNACVAPTTTVGYGHGADEANDCGRVLHMDNYVIYTRGNKVTSPALHFRIEGTGEMFYAHATPTDHTISRLHLMKDGQEYTIYDDSLLYGERDFDTGLKITQ